MVHHSFKLWSSYQQWSAIPAAVETVIFEIALFNCVLFGNSKNVVGHTHPGTLHRSLEEVGAKYQKRTDCLLFSTSKLVNS